MFEKFTGNRQINLQMNRFLGPHMGNPVVAGEVRRAAPGLTDGSAVTRAFSDLARAYERDGDLAVASACYGLAAFYLPLEDPGKRGLVEGFRRCFYAAWDGPALERFDVPYGAAALPAVRIRAAGDGVPGSPRTLVVFGGFDSYLEEVVGFLAHLVSAPFDIVAFDGPGQGSALLRGLKLTNAWERPVGAVLDALGLRSCALLGISLGGYLAMRAASFEPRVERVVAMDVMYRLLDALAPALPRPVAALAVRAARCRRPRIVDHIVTARAARDVDLSWKLQQARALTGLQEPHRLLRAFARYTMEPLFPLIRQDCLLMAGEDDQYVPFRRLCDVERGLVNAASVTVRAFMRTEDPGAAQHCQVGNLPLAFGVVRDWLEPWARGI